MYLTNLPFALGELYYVCVDSVPTLETCPADQLFDLIYEGCNFEGTTLHTANLF
jgi:hypothetical protein